MENHIVHDLEYDSDLIKGVLNFIFGKTVGPSVKRTVNSIGDQIDFKKIQSKVKKEFARNVSSDKLNQDKVNILYNCLCLPNGMDYILNTFSSQNRTISKNNLKEYVKEKLEEKLFSTDEIEYSLELVDKMLMDIEAYVISIGYYNPNSLSNRFLTFYEENKKFWETSLSQNESFSEKLDKIYAILDKSEEKTSYDQLSIENLRQIIRESSKRAFKSYTEDFGRFANIKIIESLLPNGHESEYFEFKLKNLSGKSYSVKDIEDKYNENISIIGEGGIGKTTFFQYLMEREFSLEESQNPIPIFVELNQCPEEIIEWYDKYNKSNFITRYICNLVSLYYTEMQFPKEYLIEMIEDDFHREAENGIPTYRLLLDGFNEVSLESKKYNISVRIPLSNEIEVLSSLKNVSILTNSRPTRSANYTKNFSSFVLSGLEEDIAIKYIQEHRKLNFPAEYIYSNKRLMKTLKIPLYLLLFCMIPIEEEYLPESQGEILYLFFHRNGNYYNLQSRIHEIGNSILNSIEYGTVFVMDFLLPYIGWYMEVNDTFHINESILSSVIDNCLSLISSSQLNSSVNLKEFDFSFSNVKKTSIQIQNMCEKEQLVVFMSDYLGLLYNTESVFNYSNERRAYGFIHHYFRDYFSSMWEIHVLKILVATKESNDSLIQTLGNTYWSKEKAIMIGQILQEYKNAPILNPKTNNWYLPTIKDDRELLLNTFKLYGNETISLHTKRMIKNLFLALKESRRDLSGICFDNLSLLDCNLFGVNFSKRGKTSRLLASFNKTKLSEKCFEPIDHLDAIEEYIYTTNNCITIDQQKCIKSWDLVSGTLNYQINVSFESEYPRNLDRDYIKISKDENYLAVKMDSMESSSAFVYVYNLEDKEKSFMKCLPNEKYQYVTGYAFSNKENVLYIVFGSNDKTHALYRFDFTNFNQVKAEFMLDIDPAYLYQFYFKENGKDFYLVSTYNSDEAITELCYISKYSSESNVLEDVFEFNSNLTYPPIAYLKELDSFFLYDQIDEFDGSYKLIGMESNNETEIHIDDLDSLGISPNAIYPIKGSANIYHIVFDTDCFIIHINESDHIKILEHLDISILDDEMFYYSPCQPTGKRYILYDLDGNKYEQNIELEKIQRKYNTKYYETVACLYDERQDFCILVHRENGVSIFSNKNSKYKLTDSFAYSDSNYSASGADYSSESGILAILFEDNENRSVQLVQMETFETEIIYAEKLPLNENIEICMNKSGDYLMILTSSKCYEYSIKEKKCYEICSTKENEILLYSYYEYNSKEYIHIGIGMKNANKEPTIKSRCEVYLRNNEEYSMEWGYYLPHLSKVQSQYFIHQNHDLGVFCRIQPDGTESFRVSSGFFMEDNEETRKARLVQTFDQNRNNKSMIEIGLYSFIMAEMTFVIDQIEVPKGTLNAYSYLDYDFKKAIFIYDYELIKIWDNLKNAPDKFIMYNYKEEPEYTGSGSLVWDFAVPLKGNKCICCFNNYMICVVNMDTGKVEYEINYTPGLAIQDCSFYDADTDDNTKNIITINGGVLQKNKRKKVNKSTR